MRVRQIVFTVREGYDEQKAEIKVGFAFDVNRTFPTPQRLNLRVAVRLFEGEPAAPFSLQVQYEAEFSVADASATENLRRFAKYNGPSLVVPYLREAISDITARSGFGALVMPPFNIRILIDQHDAPEASTTRGPGQTPSS